MGYVTCTMWAVYEVFNGFYEGCHTNQLQQSTFNLSVSLGNNLERRQAIVTTPIRMKQRLVKKIGRRIKCLKENESKIRKVLLWAK